MTLVVLAFETSSRAAARNLATELNCKLVDVDSLYGVDPSLLGQEYAFCAISEVAIAAATGRVIVVCSVDAFFRNKRQGKSLIIKDKLKKMLCSSTIDMVALLPQTTNVPDYVSDNMRIIRHTDDADPSIKSFAQCAPPPVTRTFLACNQLRVIYLDAEETARHETILFDADSAQSVSFCDLSPLESSIEGVKVVVPQANGCSLICLPPRIVSEDTRYGQHITLKPGRTESGKARMPAKMRMVAKSIEKKEVVCIISEDDKIDLSVCKHENVRVRPIAWAFDVFV
uniref:Uncharacterized protein n=1 Tax=Ditylum brightwellii TaxID=49249 RepID=A0A7S4R015_9STRA|mmetsp:Transcript_6980/g.9286  ORF Transcript_6980/g.9286 Transcript_6980/m.9286 type:complete len:285 (+) Transcript_6980:1989-2843(+)